MTLAARSSRDSSLEIRTRLLPRKPGRRLRLGGRSSAIILLLRSNNFRLFHLVGNECMLKFQRIIVILARIGTSGEEWGVSVRWAVVVVGVRPPPD